MVKRRYEDIDDMSLHPNFEPLRPQHLKRTAVCDMRNTGDDLTTNYNEYLSFVEYPRVCHEIQTLGSRVEHKVDQIHRFFDSVVEEYDRHMQELASQVEDFQASVVCYDGWYKTGDVTSKPVLQSSEMY